MSVCCSQFTEVGLIVQLPENWRRSPLCSGSKKQVFHNTDHKKHTNTNMQQRSLEKHENPASHVIVAFDRMALVFTPLQQRTGNRNGDQ